MATRTRTKRIIALGDIHAGHAAGLTAPHWHGAQTGGPRFADLRREMWARYAAMIERWAPVHAVICNGDAIDGTGARAGGVEQITPDRDEQAKMAVAALAPWQPKAGYWLTYGTPYHTGDGEDFEALVAERLTKNAKIHAEIHADVWLNVNGCVIGAKHKVGASGIPHGRHTAVAREKLWNGLWADREQQPRANVLLRSHVHYHAHCGGPGWLAMTLPALQAAATRYGARQCSGTVDWGIVIFDITSEGNYQWQADIVRLAGVAAETSKL